MKTMKEEVEKHGLKLSVTENGEEGKKMIASSGFLENELSEFRKEEGETLADSVETLGVDLRTRVKSLGAKEKARRKKCKVRFLIIKKNKAFQKKLHGGGRQEVATCRHGASKNMESACSGDGSYRKI